MRNNNETMEQEKVLPIVELYAAVQSEGKRAGMPTIIIRTTGCTHRCSFGEGGWCDSPYTSLSPEKGKYTFDDIVRIYDENPHISEMMLTGGAPTMHPKLIQRLIEFKTTRDIFMTMETEGSVGLSFDTGFIDLLSISPKFSNSVPQLGSTMPHGKIVTQKIIDMHNRNRTTPKKVADMIRHNSRGTYQIKPVWDGQDAEVILDIVRFNSDLKSDLYLYPNIVPNEVYIMPAGDSRESLQKSYAKVFDWVTKNGFKMTWRPHIIAFEDKRLV